MGQKLLIIIFITALLLGAACSKKSTQPEDPLDRFIAGVSFGSDTLITDMTDPLIISFITIMDRESVENAFSSDPQFGYSPHWALETHFDPNDPDVVADNLRFYLYPDLPFIPNTIYTCSIDTTATDEKSENLPVPFEFEFTTAPTMLMDISPKYDGVDPDNSFPQAIRLSFNTAIDLSTIQQPFVTDPPFEYELYGVSRQKHMFEYRIRSALEAKRQYQVGFSGQIFDIWGNLVDTDTTINFDTGPVEVIYYFPNPYFNLKSKRPIIQVRFNTIMDKQSTEDAFSFSHSVAESSGTFYWLADKALQYFLDHDLLKDEEYTIRVSTSATDTYGTPLSEAFSYTFVF
jgi:hypothetical protein